MAQHRRRSVRRKAKGGEGAAGFFASLPDDKNWMAALSEERDDEPPVGRDVEDVPGTAVSAEEWTAVQALVEQQGSMIVALLARADALESALADVAGRLPPVAGPHEAPLTRVRDVVRSLQQQAAGVAARVRPPGEPPPRPWR